MTWDVHVPQQDSHVAPGASVVSVAEVLLRVPCGRVPAEPEQTLDAARFLSLHQPDSPQVRLMELQWIVWEELQVAARHEAANQQVGKYELRLCLS